MADKTHAVWDSVSLARQAEGHSMEARQDFEDQAFFRKMQQQREVVINDYANFEHQQGHRLVSPIFEGKVRKLVPNIHFFTRPLTDDQAAFCGLAPGSSIKSMDLTLQDGHSRPIAAFQNQPIVPEYTCLLHRKVKIQNPLVHEVDSKNFPKAHEAGPGVTPQLAHYEFEDTTPLEIEVLEPCGILVGWRQLLACLVHEGLTTPTAVEKEFGISERESWAVRMGRRDNTLTI